MRRRAAPGGTIKESAMLISPAYAQAAGGGQGDLLMSLLPLVLIFVVFYFLLIRPQQKRAKEHKAMLGALRRGDRVVTGGGIVGTIARVPNDEEVVVEVADGVRVRVLRGTISTILAKGAGDRDRDEEPAAVSSAKSGNGGGAKSGNGGASKAGDGGAPKTGTGG